MRSRRRRPASRRLPTRHRAAINPQGFRKVILPPASPHADTPKLVSQVLWLWKRIKAKELEDGRELPKQRRVSVVLPTAERVCCHA